MEEPPDGLRRLKWRKSVSEYSLEMAQVRKRADGQWILEDASLQVRKGEIHGLLGDGGAGKTMLMQILAGLCRPDGCVTAKRNGQITAPGSGAWRKGIGWIPADRGLVDGYTGYENFLLGGRMDKTLRQRAAELQRRYGLTDVPLDVPAGRMSAYERMQVTLLKCLVRQCDVLLLDDVWRMRTCQQKEAFSALLQTLAREGKTILISGGEPRDMMAWTDRCTVLRDGKTVKTVSTALTDAASLEELMTGTDEAWTPDKLEIAPGSVVLEVRDLRVPGPDGRKPLINGVSFEVRAGEIVCLTGNDGGGQEICAEALMGLRPLARGRIRLGGKIITRASTRDRMRSGISYMPAEENGLLPDAPLSDSLVLHRYWDLAMQDSGVIRKRAVRSYAADLMENYEITGDADSPARFLPRQDRLRALAARAVERERELLIAVRPTEGADRQTAWEIHQDILGLRESRKAVLVITRDVEEVKALADRIFVMNGGEIVAELDPALTTEEEIGLLMTTGLRQEKYGRMTEEDE